jgi:branched-chain amino acid transport system permease protein
MLASRGRRVALILIVLGLAMAPLGTGSYQMLNFSLALVYAIALLGTNVITGYCGQLSIAASAFLTVGAFTTAILGSHGWPVLATIPVAALVSAVLGLLLGLIAMRQSGFYLSLVTFIPAAIAPALVLQFSSVTGGSNGIIIGYMNAPVWTGLTESAWNYLVVLALAAIVFLFGHTLMHSSAGRQMIAVRDHELAAESIGVFSRMVRIKAFIVSSLFIGVAGSLYALLVGGVSSDTFTLTLGLYLIAGAVIGGLNSVPGAVIGGLFIAFTPSYASDINPALAGLFFGAMIIVAMRVAPGGVAGAVGQLMAVIQRRLAVKRRRLGGGAEQKEAMSEV